MIGRKLWSSLAIVTAALGAFGVAKPAAAADYSNSNPEMGVMLSSIEDDTDTNNSTWELNTKPGKVLHGAVSVQNTSNESAKYTVSFEQARTNSQMNIMYSNGGTNKSLDPNMKLSKIAKVDGKDSATITVPANSTTALPVTLTMPAKEFDGYILGSVVVTKQVPKGYKVKDGFTNQFMYTKTVQITESIVNPTAVLTNTKKGGVKVVAGQQEFQLRIKNNEPSYIGNMKMSAKITYKKTGDVVLTDKQTGRSVAPNSSFTYRLPSERVMRAGKYHYVVTMTNEKTKKSCTFINDFVVSQASATSVGIGRSIAFIPTWIWQLLALFLVLIGFLFFLLWKRRKDEDDEDEANAK